MTKGNHPGPVLTTAVFWATAGTHLKDGVLHITDLYAGAVVCGFAGEKRFEPEQEHTKKNREQGSQTHPRLARSSALITPAWHATVT